MRPSELETAGRVHHSHEYNPLCLKKEEVKEGKKIGLTLERIAVRAANINVFEVIANMVDVRLDEDARRAAVDVFGCDKVILGVVVV
jgi:hypothetical protein